MWEAFGVSDLFGVGEFSEAQADSYWCRALREALPDECGNRGSFVIEGAEEVCSEGAIAY